MCKARPCNKEGSQVSTNNIDPKLDDRNVQALLNSEVYLENYFLIKMSLKIIGFVVSLIGIGLFLVSLALTYL